VKRTVAAVALGALVVFAAPANAEPVNLAAPGLVVVAVSDPSATVAGVAPARTGAADGRVVAHYDKQALIRAGALSAATTRLVASDGSVAEVEPEVVLEVKLASGARKSRIAGDLQPLVSDVDFTALAAKARARTGRSLPDMGAWQRLTLPAGTDADAKIKELLASGEVADAYVAPDMAPPPQLPPTPDFTGMQGYLRPTPQGIDADFSRQDPRTRGARVTIADLEYYWTADHEDLQLDPVATDLGKTEFPQYTGFNDEHGTAVFGEMVAKDNGYGVTGGVPDATMRGISPTRARPQGGTSYNTAAALTYAGQFLKPGDIVLVEQQTPGPAGGSAYVPIEWTQANFDAIKGLSALGIIVMETGGNGGQDLDSAPMQGRFDRAVRDSGAVIGGAGSATTRAALNFSSYGTRVDLQGWGEQITTTGSGGNLFGGNAPENRTRRYTRSFSGTSGAGPIVVNAIAAVQSYLKATGQPVYDSAKMRDLLRRTGTPATGTRIMGPLPNLAAALKDIEVDGPVVTASFSPADVNGWYLNPTITLTADDGWGVGVKEGTIEYRLDGGDWKPYTGPFQVLTPNAHLLETRALDLKGNTAVKTTNFNVYDLDTPVGGGAGGSVPATLSLTLGTAASFGAFVPGVDRTYMASTNATVISSAGDAALTVADPDASANGRLVNGTFALTEAVEAKANAGAFGAVTGSGLRLVTYTGPISNDIVAVDFRQHIGVNEPLRTGTYAKTLTFTLSTTTP
jgi:hypothetical protein